MNMKPDTQNTIKGVIALVLQTVHETSKQIEPVKSAVFGGASPKSDNSEDDKNQENQVISTPMVSQENNLGSTRK